MALLSFSATTCIGKLAENVHGLGLETEPSTMTVMPGQKVPPLSSDLNVSVVPDRSSRRYLTMVADGWPNALQLVGHAPVMATPELSVAKKMRRSSSVVRPLFDRDV